MPPKSSAQKRAAPAADTPAEKYVPKRVRRTTRSTATLVDSQGFTWQSPEPETRPLSPARKKKRPNPKPLLATEDEMKVDPNPEKPSKASKKDSAKSKAKPKVEAASKKNAKASAKSSAKPSTKSTAKSDQIDRNDGETCFWLMKAEPESRLEKGVDVKFSIDDLAAKDEPEAWDGVRNPVAQKNMRSMRAGELAFFYHSNCKVPGIAGVMQIVREQTPDESAFDTAHPYYDPKSDPENPRWCVVHVRFVKKFDELVPLKKLQEHAKDGGPLATLQTLKMSRLSVSRVMPDEWTSVLALAGVEQKEIDDLVDKLEPL